MKNGIFKDPANPTFTDYPKHFTIPSGMKYLKKTIPTLTKGSKRRNHLENLERSMDVLLVTKQKEFALHGNSIKLTISDTNGENTEKIYGFLDGNTLTERILPGHHRVISIPDSELGQRVVGKKVGEGGTFQDEKNTVKKFTVERIDHYEEGKWVHHLPEQTTQRVPVMTRGMVQL